MISIRSWYNTYEEIERRNIKVKLRGQIRADKVTDFILYNLKRDGFFVMLIRLAHSAMLRFWSSFPKYSAAALLTP